MFYSLSEEQLRSICKKNIEMFERWGRIVVDRELTEHFGSGYIDANSSDGNTIIKKAIINKSKEMMKGHPDRFSKPVDTFFIDELIYVLCKEQLHKEVFKEVLHPIYPEGATEARTFLNRLE